MNLFDKLVDEALRNQSQLSSLRMVVEKELLHHDILRVLSTNHLLKDLTFIGGTCLRCCYSGIRLSEDLDFTGGADFQRTTLSHMGEVLTQNLAEKYSLPVTVSEPTKDKSNVDTWKVKVETRPKQKNIPAQRINIDICAVPSYERQPMMLLNPYNINMGTSGLIIQAQSREEIFADKLLAFALRPNRLKYRDLWDMVWLHGLSLKPRFELLSKKLLDRKQNPEDFLQLFTQRKQLLTQDKKIAREFNYEMQRFLPVEQINKQDGLWTFIIYLVNDLETQMRQYL